MRRRLKPSDGFTLIELIIVMVIIGILAVLLLPGLSSGPKRARDSQRKSDLRTVTSALEQYFADNQGYPTSDYAAISASPGPLLTNYIKTMPRDPKAGQSYTYTHTAACTTTCPDYTLTATLEYPSAAAYTVQNQQ